MKKLLLICSIVLGSYALSAAQVSTAKEMEDLVLLKFSPLSFFDFDNTVQLGIEVPLKNRRFAIQQELGYGHAMFNPWYVAKHNRIDKTTFRTRSQFRFYFHDWGAGRIYVAGEYFGKLTSVKNNAWSGVNCEGGCDYLELKEVTQRKVVHGLHTKIGWHFYFPNRVTLEIYTGVGFRIKTYKTTPENSGYINPGMYGFFDNADWGSYPLYPSIAAGFQIGVPLSRKSNN